MPSQLIPYKRFPFVRLVVPLMAGIIIQWYLQLPIITSTTVAILSVVFLLLFISLPTSLKFLLRWLQGLLILILMAAVGAIITFQNDTRHNKNWFDNYLSDTSVLLVTLQEPLVVKAKSYKALATVDAVQFHNKWQHTEGKILIYFKKNSSASLLDYGSQIIVHKSLQPITNSGNPAAFDYKRYCLFHDITYQVFLKNDEYVLLPQININWLRQLIFNIRDATIAALQKNISGKKEQGVAEALLIGYRDDLDKNLVQAYSNAGVVHLIAISGLHIGMIYWAMMQMFSFVRRNKFTFWLKPAVILLVLWGFTLVAGAAPSVLRSTVMFSFVLVGDMLERRHNIYNTLAASAFCLLITNPFMLWDVGFQLSYSAVVSILIFMNPVYNWLFFQNKIVNFFWELAAVTLSVQILTFPLVLFHFHRFPNLFFIANFVAVPVSGIILFVELLLLCLSWWSGAAHVTGIVLSFLLRVMNSFIENIDRLPFAVTDNIQVNIVQAILLFVFVVAAAILLLRKISSASLFAASCLAAFFAIRTVDIMKHRQQQKLIVYNVPKYTAIDFISGDKYNFAGDKIAEHNVLLKNFHLKPARTMYRVTPGKQLLNSSPRIFNFSGKKILLLNSAIHPNFNQTKIPVDIIIISGNPKIYINQLQSAFTFGELVFDSSNPLWKIERWKKDCDSLHLRFYSVPQQGAFVLDLKP